MISMMFSIQIFGSSNGKIFYKIRGIEFLSTKPKLKFTVYLLLPVLVEHDSGIAIFSFFYTTL